MPEPTHGLSGPTTLPSFEPQEEETVEADKARIKTETTTYHDTIMKATKPAGINAADNRRWKLVRALRVDTLYYDG